MTKKIQGCLYFLLLNKISSFSTTSYCQLDIILGTRCTVCSLKHICESVLESFVSRFENHFYSRRSTDEETSNEEFEIAVVQIFFIY